MDSLSQIAGPVTLASFHVSDQNLFFSSFLLLQGLSYFCKCQMSIEKFRRTVLEFSHFRAKQDD